MQISRTIMPDTTIAVTVIADDSSSPPQLGFGTEFEAEVGAGSLHRAESPEVTAGGAAAYTIKKLRVENFKGFAKFEIDFGRFNVLVGGNNSGKSTLLRALRLAYELTKLHFHRHKG